MSPIAWRGAKLKTGLALASLLGLVVISWAGVHVAAGRSGPRMISVGSSQDAAGSVAVSPGGKTLFALIAKSTSADAVTPVNLAAGRAAKPLRLGGPQNMVASPDSALLYVLDDSGGKSLAVVPVSVASGRPGRPIPVPAGSQALAISPDGRTLYVGAGNPYHRRAGEVIAIDARSGKARAPIPVPRNVWDLAISPGGSRLYGLPGLAAARLGPHRERTESAGARPGAHLLYSATRRTWRSPPASGTLRQESSRLKRAVRCPDTMNSASSPTSSRVTRARWSGWQSC